MHLVGVALQELHYVLLVVIIIIVHLLGVLLVVIDALLTVIVLLVIAVVLNSVRAEGLHVLLPLEGLEVLRLNKLVFVHLGHEVVDMELLLLFIVGGWVPVRFGRTVDACDELIEDCLGHYGVVIDIVAAVIGDVHL